MAKLTGKVAVVTGSSRGIGAGIAERLARDGASVVVNYVRSKTEADKVVKSITGAGGKAVAVQADVSQPASIGALFEAAMKSFGRLDILVNNAGVAEVGGLDSITPESIDRMFNLNVKGLILATQAAARLFPAEGGVVINISSCVVKSPSAAYQVYCSTKGAVDVFTRGLAVELGPRKIRVVGIAPGLVVTDIVSGIEKEGLDAMVSRTPLGRAGTPVDIAAAVSFAASEDGGWITGETIQVCGGLLL